MNTDRHRFLIAISFTSTIWLVRELNYGESARIKRVEIEAVGKFLLQGMEVAHG